MRSCCIYKRPYEWNTIKSAPWRCPECHQFEAVPIATIIAADTMWGRYSVKTDRMRCGHDRVCWQLSLESIMMLKCSQCGDPQSIGPSNDRATPKDELVLAAQIAREHRRGRGGKSL